MYYKKKLMAHPVRGAGYGSVAAFHDEYARRRCAGKSGDRFQEAGGDSVNIGGQSEGFMQGTMVVFMETR